MHFIVVWDAMFIMKSNQWIQYSRIERHTVYGHESFKGCHFDNETCT